MSNEFCVVTTTLETEEQATEIARGLVEGELAACVQIVAIRSVYRWQGAVSDAVEHLLLIKTRSLLYPEIEAFLADVHPYDLPEILVLPIDGGSHGYLEWLASATG